MIGVPMDVSMIAGMLAGIMGELANHLWQSTIFAVAAALLALAFRRNRAQVRYWLWLAASAKFLIPFSALAAIGGSLWESLATRRIAAEIAAPATAMTMEQVAEPFRGSFSATGAIAASAPHAVAWIPIAIFSVWACGFAAIAVVRLRGWMHVRSAVRASKPMEMTANAAATMEIRSCPGPLEPGVVGFWHPVLLLPEGIAENLTPEQLEAVLAHELSHVRRRDNLTALIQMIAEAVFWFYPPVWWIGARLVEERERACDEAVLSLGGAPRDYADAILNVCKMYVESPVECMAGISGADLKKRVVRIMKRTLGEQLTPGRKLLLGAAVLVAIAAPVVFGLAAAQQDSAPPSEAEQQAQQEAAQFGPDMKYDVVSIRVDNAGNVAPLAVPGTGPRMRQGGAAFLPDGLTMRNISVDNLFLTWAYAGTPHNQIFGEPDWWKSERYDVLAKTNGTVAEELQKMPPDQQMFARAWMMQELMADRFKLKVHWETRQLPRYAIAVAKGVPKFKETPPNEYVGRDMLGVDGKPMPRAGRCYGDGPGQARFVGVTMAHLALCLQGSLGRSVVDETGLAAHYDFKLRWDPSRDESDQAGDASASASTPGAGNQPAFAAATPSGFPGLRKAMEHQLGLELRDEVGPVRVLVIDHVEKPATESAAANANPPQDASAAPPNAGTPQSAVAPTPTQETPKFGPEFKYDVASIKPGDPNENNGGYSTTSLPDGNRVTNMPLMDLLKMAYAISNDKRLIGVPEWAKSERYTVEAKMDASVADKLKKLKPDQQNLARGQMLQQLLAQRFGLKSHWETREMPIYELVVAKGGPKLAPIAIPADSASGRAPSIGSSEPKMIGTKSVQVPLGSESRGTSNGQIVMGGGSMESLAEMLSGQLGREVRDKTGISGKYGLVLQWDPSPGQADYVNRVTSSPSAGNPAFVASTPSRFPGIQKAIEQQLGLELKDGVGPVQVLVIDRIEKPTEN